MKVNKTINMGDTIIIIDDFTISPISFVSNRSKIYKVVALKPQIKLQRVIGRSSFERIVLPICRIDYLELYNPSISDIWVLDKSKHRIINFVDSKT